MKSSHFKFLPIGWTVENGCDPVKRSEHFNIPSHTRPAVNGMYQYSIYVECSTNGKQFKAVSLTKVYSIKGCELKNFPEIPQ